MSRFVPLSRGKKVARETTSIFFNSGCLAMRATHTSNTIFLSKFLLEGSVPGCIRTMQLALWGGRRGRVKLLVLWQDGITKSLADKFTKTERDRILFRFSSLVIVQTTENFGPEMFLRNRLQNRPHFRCIEACLRL